MFIKTEIILFDAKSIKTENSLIKSLPGQIDAHVVSRC